MLGKSNRMSFFTFTTLFYTTRMFSNAIFAGNFSAWGANVFGFYSD